MSGHSKWAKIKRAKAATDAKRGKVFSKIIREIGVAARDGGGQPDSNPRLRMVMDKARQMNMPMDNIKRAIARGTGQGEDAAKFEEVAYEGYGPGGAAILVEALTDNKNRTSAELRAVFTRNGGNMGEPGCVAWVFQPIGLLTFDRARFEEEALLNAALEAGAEDFKATDGSYEVVTKPEELDKVRSALADKGLEAGSVELTKIPKSTVPLEGKAAENLVRLMEAIEEHDDVQNVYGNFEISDKVLESLVGTTAS